MKYIGLFENFNETTEDFFKPIINWKLIEYLEYELTKIADMSDEYSYAVFVKTSETNIWSKYDKSKKGEYNLDTDLYQLKKTFYKNNLTYGFSTFIDDDAEIQPLIDDLLERVKKVFDVSEIDNMYSYVDIKLKRAT